MSTVKILCPRCPLCDGRPAPWLPISLDQAFCADPKCKVMCWSPSKSLDENLIVSNFIEPPEGL